jgi:hypothetical protein
MDCRAKPGNGDGLTMSLIGAAARVRGALIGPKPRSGTFVEAIVDPVTERATL